MDLVFHGSAQQQLEYDLVLAPGVDPRRAARWPSTGVERASIDGGGAAVLALAGGGELRKAAARRLPGERGRSARPGAGPATGWSDDGTLGFEVGDYDRSRPLVIDPVVLFSTYLGGSNSDGAAAMAVDAGGNVYLTGLPVGQLPRRLPVQRGCRRLRRLRQQAEPAGAALVYSTYLGGSGEDRATGIAVDAAGNAHVTGYTLSTNFPTVAPFLQGGAAGGARRLRQQAERGRLGAGLLHLPRRRGPRRAWRARKRLISSAGY